MEAHAPFVGIENSIPRKCPHVKNRIKPKPSSYTQLLSLYTEAVVDHGIRTFKVSGPVIETSCVFLCIKNIINAEMWA